MGYSIGEVAARTGLTAHTLRYYEKEGLLPFVSKNRSGMREYSRQDLAWLSMIECLKASGLQLKEIAQYIGWFKEGDSTLKQRLQLFQKRRAVVEQEVMKLHKILDKLTYKEALYREAVALGSLDAAMQKPEMQALKEMLFQKPDDFDQLVEDEDSKLTLDFE